VRKVLGIALVLAALAGGAYYLFADGGPDNDGMALDDDPTRPKVKGGSGPKDPEARVDLDDLLLARADLPDGYRRTEAPDEDEPMCEASENLDDVEPDDEADVAFAAAGREFVVEKVRQYRGSRAEDAFDVIRDEVERCSRFTDEEDEGEDTLWIVDDLDVGEWGDERLAVRLTTETDDSQVDAVYVRYDGVIVALAYVASDADEADERLAGRLLEEIDRRVP
jgi:hypothetical protein